MNRHFVCDLADCSEFRQTVAMRAPGIVQGSILLLVLLLVFASVWLVQTQASIVVKARGRVRPIEKPTRVYAEHAAQLDGRVEQVLAQPGDKVKAGQILVRLDTRRLDNEIARVERKLSAAREELAELARMEVLTTERFEAAQAKAAAELAQAKGELHRATEQRTSEIRAARAALAAAEDRLNRRQRLVPTGAITQEQLLSAENDVRQASEKLKQASLPVDRRRVDVLEKAADLVTREDAVAQAKIRAQQVVRRGMKQAAEKELSNLLLQRQRAELRSPIDGVVISGHPKVGDLLQPGQLVLQVARADGFRFEADVASEDVGRLTVGMPVRIKFDAYDFQKYGTLEGQVSFLSPDSKLVPQSRDQAGGVTYTVRVDLPDSRFGTAQASADVKLGLSGTAEMVTDRLSLLKILIGKIRGTISLG